MYSTKDTRVVDVFHNVDVHVVHKSALLQLVDFHFYRLMLAIHDLLLGWQCQCFQ